MRLALRVYWIGENADGIRILFSCAVIAYAGMLCFLASREGGHTPAAFALSRVALRSSIDLYGQMWTNLLSAPSSETHAAHSGLSLTRSAMPFSYRAISFGSSAPLASV